VRKRVEVLSFSGCPNASATVALVEQVAKQTGVDVDIRAIDVPDPAAAIEQRFLGSPTVRVDGRDVEPGSDSRTDFAFACRVYQGPAGPRGLPTREWLETALRARVKEER